VPDPVLRLPALVVARLDGTRPADSGGLRIRARRCGCGHVFHPPHAYGCERCGREGTATEPVDLEPCGVLCAFATVHTHPKLPTPFTLGRVALDAGPAIDVWLDGVWTQDMLGERVRGTLVPGGGADSGAPLLDLRFTRRAADGGG
jgi:uncharacterized OB-fold protein